MPKFDKGVEELSSHFEKWMYVIKQMPMLANIPASLQEKIFQKVFTLAELANLSADEARAYENSLKDYRDYNNVLAATKLEGEEKGIKQGREEGIQQGVQGVARRMLAQGMPIEEIMQWTGLSQEAIEKMEDDCEL